MVNYIIEEINSKKFRSAWDKGVQQYAIELITDFEYDEVTQKNLLKGAKNWKQYSSGACSLVGNYEIAMRLCTKSELKKTNFGEKNPNSTETWIDCQARALYQASILVIQSYWNYNSKA